MAKVLQRKRSNCSIYYLCTHAPFAQVQYRGVWLEKCQVPVIEKLSFCSLNTYLFMMRCWKCLNVEKQRLLLGM